MQTPLLKGVKNILVMKCLHIGDVLLITPTLRALNEAYPNAKLYILVNSGTEEMLQGNPYIDEIIIYHRPRGRGFKRRVAIEWLLLREIRKRSFDLTVDLTGGDHPSILGWLSGAKYRIGPYPERKGAWWKKWIYTHANSKRNVRKHMVEQNLDIVGQIGVHTEKKELNFALSREEQMDIQKRIEKYGIVGKNLKIHIHPTSLWFFKCWKDEYFAKLIDQLFEKFHPQIILTCSPDPREKERARKIFDLTNKKPIDLMGQTTLRELGGIAKASDLFIGVDSAPMHLAAAVGTPTVALFGPSVESVWHPWGAPFKLLKKNQDCNPHGSSGCVTTKRCLCLEKISVDEVMEAVRGMAVTSQEGSFFPTPPSGVVLGQRPIFKNHGKEKL